MAVMESTTLITFMLQHPAARKVELLGSWDNFTESYPMDMDRRRGRGVWSGCHSFRNIICDGDLSHVHEKRAGGLKMGGTYWYFYRIDGDEESHDPSQQTTTSCPLLPGQILNVLEVPLDSEKVTSHSRSSSLSIASTLVQTLNPKDRYLTPRPAPASQLPKLVTPAEATPSSRHIPIASGPAARRENRPWAAYTAGVLARTDSRPGYARETKSASTSPILDSTGSIRAAFSQRKRPASAIESSQSGRRRDWLLRNQQLNDQRITYDRGELKSRTSRPPTVDAPDLAGWRLSGEWEVGRPLHSPSLVDRSFDLSRSSIQELRDLSCSENVLDDFPVPPSYRSSRSTSDADQLGAPSHGCEYSAFPSSPRSTWVERQDVKSLLHYRPTAHTTVEVTDRRVILSRIAGTEQEEVMSPNEATLSGRRPLGSGTANSLTKSTANERTDTRDVAEALPPLPSFTEIGSTETGQALDLLDYGQSTMEQQFLPWRTEHKVPLPESPALSDDDAASETGSFTFSSIKDGSTMSTPHRSSASRPWPLIDNVFQQDEEERADAFQFLLDTYVNRSLARLALRTAGTGTESTASTAMAYQLPGTNPFDDVDKARMGREGGHRGDVHDAASEVDSGTREMSPMEQLLDEFEYLGAALL